MNRELEEDLEKTIAAMPPPMQDAVIWAIRHFDVVKAFAEQETMSDEQLDAFAEAALHQGDYILFIMAGYTKLWREKGWKRVMAIGFTRPLDKMGRFVLPTECGAK